MSTEIMISTAEEGVQDEKLRVGVVGTGAIAQRFHIPEYQDHSDAVVTAVCDVEEKKAKEVAATFEAEEYYTDYSDLVESGTVDAVSVCLPNHLHEEVVTAALESDVHVLCEKPMATSVAEADRMIEAARNSSAILMIDQSERFHPVYVKASEVLESGLIGEIESVHSRFSHSGPAGWSPRSTWFTDAESSGGGAMVDIGIHNADIVIDTIGAVDEVMAYTDTFEYDFDVEDTAVACMQFEDGMLGTFEVSWTTDPEAIEMQVVGTEGVLYADKIAEELYVELSDERGTVDVPLPEYRSPIKRFVDASLGDEEPPVTGEEGRDALELVMAIYRAAGKGTAVSLPLDTDGDEA